MNQDNIPMERHFYLYTVVSFNKHKKHPAVSVDPAHKRYHCQNVTAFRNDFVENCSLDIKQKPLTYSRIHFKDINRVGELYMRRKLGQFNQSNRTSHLKSLQNNKAAIEIQVFASESRK